MVYNALSYVALKNRAMTPKEFHEKSPSQFACRDYWQARREMTGIECRKCNKNDHSRNHEKNEWRCRGCNSVTTIKIGNVMIHSTLPMIVWFKAIFEVS